MEEHTSSTSSTSSADVDYSSEYSNSEGHSSEDSSSKKAKKAIEVNTLNRKLDLYNTKLLKWFNSDNCLVLSFFVIYLS